MTVPEMSLATWESSAPVKALVVEAIWNLVSDVINIFDDFDIDESYVGPDIEIIYD